VSDFIPPKESILEYSIVNDSSRWELLRKINERARVGWRLVIYDADLGAIMSRSVDSKKLEEDLEHQRRALSGQSADITNALRELHERDEDVTLREKAAAEKEERLEKIRNGMIQDGQYGVDQDKVVKMLADMAPKVPEEPQPPSIRMSPS
jgi:anti-sigma28 factor (negative regulator of flagellin synthesis)